MTIKAYDGTTWQIQKSLKIYNGSVWAPAKQAWIFNGSTWAINYPEYPANTSGPSISAQSGTSGRIDCVYIINVGTWNPNDAYTPTSYTYQWTRAGSDISGATNNTYTTVAADAEKIIGCRVTAINQRGSTPITVSTGVSMLPQVTSINAYDYTTTPTAPGLVTVTPSNLTYTGSWTAGSSATTYEGYGSGTAGTPSFNYGAQIFSGTGTAGTAQVNVRSVNNTKQVFVNWGVATGAISYDVYVNGSYFTNVSPGTNNYYIYTAPDENARTFTVYPRSTNIQGYGIQYGTAVAATAKYSGYTSGSGILSQPAPSGGSVSWTASTVTVGSTISASTSGWSNSPTSYDLRIVRGTVGVIFTETTVATSTSSSISYQIPAGDATYYYKAFCTATNAGGDSGRVNSTEIGPVPTPVVIPSGGSTSLSGSVSTGSLLSASTSGWSGSPTSYFIKITRGTANVQSYETTVASSASSSTSYTVAAGDAGSYFKAFATASNSAGTSSEVASGELGPATNPVTAPGVPSVSNNYDGKIGSYYTWTLTIGQGSGGTPTGYDWELQLGSNGSTSLASSSGSVTGSGTKTVTRNSSVYIYARWRAKASGQTTWSSYTTWE
jgi:hypothetical protein